MTQEAGANVAKEAPKNDFVVTDAEQVKAADIAPTKADADAAAETEAGSPDKDSSEGKKPKTGWQRKIAKLERELAARDAALAQFQQPAPKAAEVNQVEAPKPENFQTYDEYVEALTKHNAKDVIESTLAEREKKAKTEAEQRKAHEDLVAKGARYEQAKEEIRAVHADFDEKIAAYDGPQSPMILMALLDSEKPAEVAYYLANNLEEADKMEGMSLLQVNRFIAKIEAKLEAPKDAPKPVPETPQAPKAAVTTKAPPPVTPVRGSAKSDTGYSDDFSFEQHQAWRKKQRNK